MFRVAAVQDAPVFLDREATTHRVIGWMEQAADAGAQIVAFPESFLPGYPFWVCRTDGARFNDAGQKEAYRAYHDAAVKLDGPELGRIAAAAAKLNIFVLLGIAERGAGPGSGSIYCTAVPICPQRGLLPAHRKLVPTYDERLVWASGDGHGLRAHDCGHGRVSALNCWENWMPQARHALYADGTQIHFSLWPGSSAQTEHITRFIALEGRMFVVSVSGLLQLENIPHSFPLREQLLDEHYFTGGSAIASPDGNWVVEPISQTRGLITAELDLAMVARERLLFDSAGHYARPDVFDVRIHRKRLVAAQFIEDVVEDGHATIHVAKDAA